MDEATRILIARAKAIKAELKALGVVCFGYFRYRNARFGCAEVHQAIQAYGRHGMTQTRRIAEQHGMRVIHTMTDCVFLHKPGISRADANRFSRDVSRDLGVPMELEGVYKWLVLLPSKTHSTTSDVGVPTRYYGLMDDGTLKVRGIEVRRHSTPPWLLRVQEEMLQVLCVAQTPEAFLDQMPEALEVAKRAARELMSRSVPMEELAVTTQTRMSVEDYSAHTATKVALKSLREAGVELQPGQYLRFVHTKQGGPKEGRAVPLEMLGERGWFGGTDAYHIRSYLRLLARSVETLFASFGVTEDDVFDWFLGRRKDLVPPRQVALPRPTPTWVAR